MEIIEDRFQHCVKVILEHEGGLSQDKNDPGGTTNWGISLRYLRTIGMDINHDGVINDDDIIGLPLIDAVKIYRKYWWDAYRYTGFNELVVVEKVFDLAVNMGAHGAHKLLQKAINFIRPLNDLIVVDGILGGETFAAANALYGDKLRDRLRIYAHMRYLQIIENNPQLEVFKNGWFKRAAW